MQLLDGKKTAQILKMKYEESGPNEARREKVPHLAAVLVGNDGASLTYVGSKVRSCVVGIQSTLVRLEDSISEEALQEIDKLNADSSVDGYIVQLPLPNHINEERILMAVDPIKDVDGFHLTILVKWPWKCKRLFQLPLWYCGAFKALPYRYSR